MMLAHHVKSSTERESEEAESLLTKVSLAERYSLITRRLRRAQTQRFVTHLRYSVCITHVHGTNRLCLSGGCGKRWVMGAQKLVNAGLPE